MKVFGKWRADYNAAFISAFFSSVRLGIEGEVDFLVDTGASKTVILDMDAESLGVNYGKLTRYKYDMIGIGGSVETYSIKEAKLTFSTNEGKVLTERFEIFVLKHPKLNKKIERLPSLLGRDVLNKYCLMMNKPSGTVYFADEIIRQ